MLEAVTSAHGNFSGGAPFDLNVEHAHTNLRDLYVEPTLSALRAQVDTPVCLKVKDLLPRDQGAEGSCIGHALAVLIDLLSSPLGWATDWGVV